jgi:hypothetical protein
MEESHSPTAVRIRGGDVPEAQPLALSTNHLVDIQARTRPPSTGTLAAILEDVRVVWLTDDSAVVRYRATARRDGDDTTYSALIGSVYVRRDATWKLAFHQQTPVDDA